MIYVKALLSLLLTGIFAGWLFGKIIKNRGFGLVGNSVIGVIGAILGVIIVPLLFDVLVIGIIFNIIPAFIGAIIALFLTSLIKKKPPKFEDGNRIDPHNKYAHYNILLVKQLWRIAVVGPRFLRAIKNATTMQCDERFLRHASNLQHELAGKPSDGALEVYRDLDKNIDTINAFISQWHSVDGKGYKDVLSVASEAQSELKHLQELVEKTPLEVMKEIKNKLKRTDSYKGKLSREFFIYLIEQGENPFANAPDEIKREFLKRYPDVVKLAEHKFGNI